MFSAWTTWWSSWLWPEDSAGTRTTTTTPPTTPSTASSVLATLAAGSNATNVSGGDDDDSSSSSGGSWSPTTSWRQMMWPTAVTTTTTIHPRSPSSSFTVNRTQTLQTLLATSTAVPSSSVPSSAANTDYAGYASLNTTTTIPTTVRQLLRNCSLDSWAPAAEAQSAIHFRAAINASDDAGDAFFDTSDFSEDQLLGFGAASDATLDTNRSRLWQWWLANSSNCSVAGNSSADWGNETIAAAAAAVDGGIWMLLPDWLAPETWQLVGSVMLTVVLSFLILATMIGNIFVIAAILIERNLQSVANYLILSLAVADLMVSFLVMPLSAIYLVSAEWIMTADACDMWTSSDVLCCTASILHLVAIALDRYWAVTNIDYIHQRTARRIGVMIAVVWALSLVVALAPLFGWKDPQWLERVEKGRDCMVSQDIGYQIFATASSFYVPLLVILVLYWRIFQAARKRIRRRQQLSLLTAAQVGGAISATSGGLIASAAGGSGGIAAAVITIIGRPLPTISETTTAFTNVSSANTSPEKYSRGGGGGGGGGGAAAMAAERSVVMDDPPTADPISAGYASGTPSTAATAAGPKSSAAASRRKPRSSTADSKRERKAAKTLAIITGAFVGCWLPFFVLAILLPACGDQCAIPEAVQNLCLWLGYFNSTLNPIIYTVFSPEFRNAFKRILCGGGRKGNLRRRTGLMRR